MFTTTEIEETIGIAFKDKKWPKQAFTHRSYLNEEWKGRDFKRAFELGDAILEF